MKVTEMTRPVTSKVLNESLAKHFGYKLQLEQFSDAQLEDVRNKLRTKLSQFEVKSNYGTILESPDYQKNKMFLDVVNQEIFEREGNTDLPIEENIDDKYNKLEDKLKYQKIRTRAYEHSVPEQWIDSAISRIKLGESDRKELSAELKLRYDLSESDASWILLESEELRAEIILASKDMVDQVTRWYEDTATMKSERLLELGDTISELLGTDVNQQYMSIVKPALESIYSTIEQVRVSLSQGLDILTGEAVGKMGADVTPGATPAPTLGSATPGTEPTAELPPPADEADRMKRESIEYGRKLSVMLSSKKTH